MDDDEYMVNGIRIELNLKEDIVGWTSGMILNSILNAFCFNASDELLFQYYDQVKNPDVLVPTEIDNKLITL